MKIYKQLLWFMEQMQYKFRKNENKDNQPFRKPETWAKCDNTFLLKRLNDEQEELVEAIATAERAAAKDCWWDVIYECADVANLAAIIANNAKCKIELFQPKKKIKLYVASSWRNQYQPEAVKNLRYWGFEVYDFHHNRQLSEIDPNWQGWTIKEAIEKLNHPIAEEAYKFDKEALDDSDGCVLILPSRCSAHLEGGYMVGQGKPLYIWSPENCEPELMYKMGFVSDSLKYAPMYFKKELQK